MTFSVKLYARGLGVLGLAASALALASPSIDHVSGVDSERVQDGQTLRIEGTGFGKKEQAAPILFDMGERAYENGKLNTHQSSFSDGQQILRPDQDPKTLWSKSSAGGGHEIYISKSRAGRVQDSQAHYYFSGPNAFLGWPAAYGGFATPAQNSKLYVAWWYKPKYSPKDYWRFSPIDIDGGFQKGEPLEIGGRQRGTFIGIDGSGLINAEIYDTTNIKGALVKGIWSGATTTFPTEFRAGSGIGYETPGSQKFIRIWEEASGKEGIRFSWTQMHQVGFGKPNWSKAPVIAGEWNLFEVEMDTDRGFVDLAVNGKEFTSYSFSSGDVPDVPGSPTIAALGLNGKTGKFQEGEIDDIYMDKTLQRVVVADSPRFEDVSHYELQRPVVWENDRIEFVLRSGALNGGTSAYVYVFDEYGNVNEAGFPVCDTCSRPAAVELKVE